MSNLDDDVSRWDESQPVEVALAYHERTKHRVGRYARSMGFLDWSAQPSPFRTFEGAERVLLDEVPPTGAPAFDDLLANEQSAEPPSLRTISQLLYDSMALSAWKQAGSNRWSLRVNPSSGNLHPTEAYLLLPPIADIADVPVLAHYSPLVHALEVRRVLDSTAWAAFTRDLPDGSFVLGFTSIHWRESWKYGERAFRYCQHDLGHAFAAVCIAARLLGWRLSTVAAHDDLVGRLLGTHAQTGPEAEHPDLLLLVTPGAAPARVDAGALLSLSSGRLLGEPNVLGESHHAWPIIDVVSRACARGATADRTAVKQGSPVSRATRSASFSTTGDARRLVRARRSALDMDGLTTMSRDAFLRVLETTLPEVTPWIFDPIPTSEIQLLLFVHRVTDVAPGLYLLARTTEGAAQLRAVSGPELDWEPCATLAGGASLVRLADADARRIAKLVSCHQDIAADGAFAVSMLARFEPTLRERGASAYRWLHWEAGAIGQLLYLEAEAVGIRSTGIGCFFDDSVHELLGVRDRAFQALYHFTVGGPVDDPRIQTVAAYHHRDALLAELSTAPTRSR